MVRLFGLLGLLGLGFLGISMMPAPERRPLAEVAEPMITVASKPDDLSLPTAAISHLPDSVRRLADLQPAAARGPVVYGEATPIPAPTPVAAEAQDTSLRDPLSPFRKIKAERANVRSGPSTDYDVVGQLLRGEEIEVLESEGSWLLVRLQGDGFEGWVSGSLLTR